MNLDIDHRIDIVFILLMTNIPDTVYIVYTVHKKGEWVSQYPVILCNVRFGPMLNEDDQTLTVYIYM